MSTSTPESGRVKVSSAGNSDAATPMPKAFPAGARAASDMRYALGGLADPHYLPHHRAAKRLLDVVGSALALVVLSPLYLVISILIKATSRGPVFYRWKVVGEGGRYITSYKFRSMIENADQLKHLLQEQNEMKGPVFKLRNDPRVTPIGRFLRKFSLDELPQLWSVLKGDLSLVGPRPPLQTEWVRFTDRQKLKLSVKPGLTCLWQISGRNKIQDFDEWVNLDLEYIRRWNFWLDLKILFQTVPAILTGRGAS
jgi:lipopolysaccharide/colanic/teichoic acid biosynthesis glycosyltransferase